MPRQIEERLVGYRFGVRHGESRVQDEKGNVIHNGNGEPKTEPEITIEFLDVQPTGVHVIRVPLTEQARDLLVTQLTGGIAIAKPGDVPSPGPI